MNGRPSPSGVDRTRLTDPLAPFFESAKPLTEVHGETDAFERLGISALARLWKRSRRRAGAQMRPRRLRRARRPARAQGAQPPRPLVFLRAARRRIQPEMELFRGPDR